MFQYQSLGGNPNLMRDGQDKIVTKKNYPQYFKLVLRSKDRDTGSTKSYAKFSDVKMPEGFSAPTVFMVESFNITLAQDGYGFPVFENLEVHLPELLQTRSWSSRTKNVTDVICVTDANASFYNGSCNVNSLGVPILDNNFFRNNQISIVLGTPENESGRPRADEDLLDTTKIVGEWVLVAYIVCLDESVPM